MPVLLCRFFVDLVDPRVDRLCDWVYGGKAFLKHVLSMAKGNDPVLHRCRVRRVSPVSADEIISATASQISVAADEYEGFRTVRQVATWQPICADAILEQPYGNCPNELV